LSNILRPEKGQDAKPYSLSSFEAQCEALLEKAKARAVEILAEARKQSDAECKAARIITEEESRKLGYQAGFDSGRQTAIEQVTGKLTEQAQPTMQMVNALAQELDKRLNALVNESELALLHLALKLAKKVIKIEVERNSEKIAGENFSRALQLATSGTKLVAAVNPADKEFLEEYFGRLKEHLALGGVVEIVADDSVSRGGVVIHTERGLVDARIDSQLEEIERQLIE